MAWGANTRDGVCGTRPSEVSSLKPFFVHLHPAAEADAILYHDLILLQLLGDSKATNSSA